MLRSRLTAIGSHSVYARDVIVGYDTMRLCIGLTQFGLNLILGLIAIDHPFPSHTLLLFHEWEINVAERTEQPFSFP